METIFINLLVAAIIFSSGLIFGEDIKKKFHEWKNVIETLNKKKKRFKIFLISCEICTDDFKKILLEQNRRQNLFQFELANWELWAGHEASTQALMNLQTNSKLRFCEAFEEEIDKYYSSTSQNSDSITNIVITDIMFPQNFYTWNTKSKRTLVIGIRTLSELFENEAKTVCKIILRIVQRMTIYSESIKNLNVHDETRGCLFDFTRLLTDLQYSIDHTFICKQCETAILVGNDGQYLKSLNLWLDKTNKNAF